MAKDKKLPYAGAQGAIRAGGSVIWRDAEGQTHLITRVEDLPSEVTWAAGNPEAEAAATRAIDEQIARLLAQRDQVAQRAAAPAGEAPAAPAPTGKGKGKGGKGKATAEGEGDDEGTEDSTGDDGAEENPPPAGSGA